MKLLPCARHRSTCERPSNDQNRFSGSDLVHLISLKTRAMLSPSQFFLLSSLWLLKCELASRWNFYCLFSLLYVQDLKHLFGP